MSETVVLINIVSGPSTPYQPSFVIWESAYRITDNGVTTIPAPGAVRLDKNGQATVTVAAGAWFVTEVVPGGSPRRRAVIVPESVDAVSYADLDEVSNPADVGFGPTWEQLAVQAATRAQGSAEDAAAYFTALTGIVFDAENGALVRTVNHQNPDKDGNVTVTVSGTIVVESITDATSIGKQVLGAADAAALRALIGAGTGNGSSTPARIDYRAQASDGSYPVVGAAPTDQLLIYVGATPPDPATTRSPTLYIQGTLS